VVKVLVEKGANVNARAKNPDWMPLHYASGMGHSKVVTYLLDRGAQLDAPTSDGYTALSGAASNAKTDNVRLLLARSADGGHALAYLMRRNNLDAIRLLLTSGVSADATPRTEYRHLGISPGETALFKAVSAQNLDLAVLLLGAGANPNIASPKSPNMPTPLMMAAYHCDGPMIDALMARGASRNTTSHSGDTAASLARKGWTTNMQPCPANILAKLQ
jgi:ankyrin repeat protein